MEDVKDRRTQCTDYFAKDNWGFSAHIDLSRENLVFFSVPYEKGWSATVNGELFSIIPLVLLFRRNFSLFLFAGRVFPEVSHPPHRQISGLKLSRNRGHQNALLAGLMTAKQYADMVISMDADLQDDVDEQVDLLILGKALQGPAAHQAVIGMVIHRLCPHGVHQAVKSQGCPPLKGGIRFPAATPTS